MFRIQLDAGNVSQLRYSPDGRQLVFAERIPRRATDPEAFPECIHPRMLRVDAATGRVERCEQGWNLFPWEHYPWLGESDSAPVNLGVTPEGRFAVTIWCDRLGRYSTAMMDLVKNRPFYCAAHLTDCSRCEHTLTLSPNGKLFMQRDVSGSHLSVVRFRLKRSTVALLSVPHPQWLYEMAFSPKSDYFAVGGVGAVYRYAVPSGKEKHTLDFSGKAEGILPVSGDARHVCFRGNDAHLVFAIDRKIYSAEWDADEVAELTSHPSEVVGLSCSPNGEVVAVAGRAGEMQLWGEGRGHFYDWGIGGPTSLAFAPDGMTGAVGGEHGQIVIWDVD